MSSLSRLANRIKSSVSSRSSDKSSAMSYSDTYFDEIGFKLGENSCLGSTESPDNLEGEEILFYQNDKIFSESGDEDEENDSEDYHESQCTYDTPEPPPLPPVPHIELKKAKEELDSTPEPVRSIPLSNSSKPQQQQPRDLRASPFQLEQSDSLEYSTGASILRPRQTPPKEKRQPSSDLAYNRTKTALPEGQGNEQQRRRKDEPCVQENAADKDENEYWTKATIKFLFVLGAYFMTVATVVLVVAFLEKNRIDNDDNNGDRNKDGLVPLTDDWDLDDDIFLRTFEPSSAPSRKNTEAPTYITQLTNREEDVVTFLGSVSPDATKSWMLEHPDSPQFKAVQWLAEDANLNTYPKEQVIQRWVLATFYWSTDGEQWEMPNSATSRNGNVGGRRRLQEQATNTSEWMSEANECTWYTTHNQNTCDEQGQLLALSLGRWNVQGSLPTELGLLSMLERLYLPDNRIVGNIPTEMALLTKLVSLHLSSNLIAGTIPSELGRLTQLDALQVHNNLLSGNIPTELGLIEALRTLQLNDNQIDGTIPQELFDLADLQVLALESNQLIGEVPTALVSLPFLTALTVYNNQISGTMPVESCNLAILIADCEEIVCECCTECCFDCQGKVGTLRPTFDTASPTSDSQPMTAAPTETPAQTTSPPSTPGPTNRTTKTPTRSPSNAPSTPMPTGIPTAEPTQIPTTQYPSQIPTTSPTTSLPSSMPTSLPTSAPTSMASDPPTSAPTQTPSTSAPRTPDPTLSASNAPSGPTFSVSDLGPTLSPTLSPVVLPECLLSVAKKCYTVASDDIILSYEGCDTTEGVWIGFFPVGLFFGDFLNNSPNIGLGLIKAAAEYRVETDQPNGDVRVPSEADLPTGNYIIYLIYGSEKGENVSGGQISIRDSC
eukprot:scaffold2195_cov132-Cylindrotheca_fusiformis.AAC.18